MMCTPSSAPSAVEDELHHAGEVAHDLTARVLAVEGAPDLVVDALGAAGLLGLARPWPPRGSCTRRSGKMASHARLVLQVERVAHGDAGLLHRGGGERGEADDVAGRVDVRDARSGSARSPATGRARRRRRRRVEAQARGVAEAARGDQDGVHRERAAARSVNVDGRRGRASKRVIVVADLDVARPAARSARSRRSRDLRVEEAAAARSRPSISVTAIAERREHGRVLAADHARADHGHGPRQRRHAEDAVAVVDARIVERACRGRDGAPTRWRSGSRRRDAAGGARRGAA